MKRTIVRWPSGCNFIQTDAYLGITTDCVLLSAFPSLSRCRRAVDLGCGVGGAGILLASRSSSLMVDLLDIQRGAVDIARENVRLNALENRVKTRCGDMRAPVLPGDSYDLAICNPPYFVTGSGKKAKNTAIETARGDGECTIDEVARSAARLLKTGGRFAAVFRPERMVDLFWAMRSAGLEPKRLRRVLDRAGTAPILILAEARKGGGVSLIHEPDLILRNSDGNYTDEVMEMYSMKEER